MNLMQLVMILWSIGLVLAGIALARAAFNRGDRFGALLGMGVFTTGLLAALLVGTVLAG